jgi:hypothetical protein
VTAIPTTTDVLRRRRFWALSSEAVTFGSNFVRNFQQFFGLIHRVVKLIFLFDSCYPADCIFVSMEKASYLTKNSQGLIMNYKEKLLIAAALIACGGNAFAANTADLKVIGKIVPAACTPTFTGGGTVDYGSIDKTTLSATEMTQLATKVVPYNINCSSAMKVGLKLTDARRSSIYVKSGEAITVNATIFGLGVDGTAQAKIGRYSVQNTGTKTADGVPVDSISSSDSGATWGGMPSGSYFKGANPASIYSYATTGTLVPLAARVFAGEFEVKTFIAPTSALDLSHEINLDGLSTLEVSYL